MKDLLNRIVEVLVDYPERIEICESGGENVCMLELRVAKSDIGKVIGKKGKTADSIRTILKCASRKIGQNRSVVLDILE